MLVRLNPSGLVDRNWCRYYLTSAMRCLQVAKVSSFFGASIAGAGFGYHLRLSSVVGYAEMWYPHNFISESLALGGFVLTVPLMVCVYLSMRSCLELLRNSSSPEIWYVAILLQSLGYVAFSGHLANVPMFWIALGLTSSFAPIYIQKGQSGS